MKSNLMQNSLTALGILIITILVLLFGQNISVTQYRITAVTVSRGSSTIARDTSKLFRPEERKKPTLVFFAGLPFSKQKEIYKVIENACLDTSQDKCLSLIDESGLDKNLFYPRIMKEFLHAKDVTRTRLQQLESSMKPGQILFANLFSRSISQARPDITWTYPDLSLNQTKGKSLLHPNILLLSELATESGFNVQVIVLFEDIFKISNKFLQTLIIEKHEYSPKTTISLLKMLDMNFRNLLAQVSVLKNIDVHLLDFTSDELISSSFARLQRNIGLNLNEQFLINHLNQQNQLEASHSSSSLTEGDFLYIQKIKVIQDFYREKLLGNSVEPVGSDISSELETDSTVPRVIFFAGLEGTGHHLWRSVTGEIRKTKKFKEKLSATCSLNKLFFDQGIGCFESFFDHPGIFCSASGATFKKSRDKVTKFLPTFKDKAPENSTFLLNLAHSGYFKGDGQCSIVASYPAFRGLDKSLNKPDLIELAHLSTESRSFSLKPIILLRRTADLVYSDIWHRGFQRKMPVIYEEKVLENNAASILIEMEVLGPNMFSCVSFNDLVSSENEMAQVASAFRMETAELESVVKGVFRKNATQEERILPGSHNEFIHTLRQYNKQLYRLCGKDI